jgi:hypothetical protein
MISLLLTALWASQDPEIGPLVDQLGDPSPEIRERACDLLESRRVVAVPVLQAALRHSDLEIRRRAKDILFRLEPSLFLEELKEAQRPARPECPIEDLPSGPDRGFADTGRFRFERKFWMERGVITGTVLTTTWASQHGTALHWTVDAVLAGCEIGVERCPIHSPGVLFVPGEVTDPCQVRIKGTRGWACRVPVTFRNPMEGEARRVGPYTITLQWPDLLLTSEQGLPADETPPISFGESIDCRLKPGRTKPTPAAIPEQEPGDEPALFFPEPRPASDSGAAWCGCPSPGKDPKPEPDVARGRLVRIRPGRWKDCPLADLASISLVFLLPVVEPFEVMSPPLK